MATMRKTHDAKNLPIMACHTVTGKVSSNSMVPRRRSSDQSRIPTAGTKKIKSHGIQLKKDDKEASFMLKNPPNVNVKIPERIKYAIKNTNAKGEPK